VGKDGFDTDGDHLCYYFINDIAECYWPKLLWVSDTLLFWNQGEESSIESGEYLDRGSGFLHNFLDFFSDHRPTMVEKIGGEAIRPWGFPRGNFLDSLIYFLLGDWSQ